MFGSFSAFRTSIAFELVKAHGLSQTGIAIFALVGAGGALAGLQAGNLVLLAVAGVLLDLAV